MSKALKTLTLTLCLVAPSAAADPFGGSLRRLQISPPNLEARSRTSCEDLRRSVDLRQRTRPSVRRSMIERCEREKQRARLAQVKPPLP